MFPLRIRQRTMKGKIITIGSVISMLIWLKVSNLKPLKYKKIIQKHPIDLIISVYFRDLRKKLNIRNSFSSYFATFLNFGHKTSRINNITKRTKAIIANRTT